MILGWPTEKEKILRGAKISAGKKLAGIRMLNELTDKILTKRQKILRRKMREN